MEKTQLLMRRAKKGKRIDQYEAVEIGHAIPSIYINQSLRAGEYVLVTVEDKVG